MTKKFDLIVIGTGVAGSTVAHKCRSAGWEVAIIDSEPFGGTCTLRGCDPKKVLFGAAELLDWSHRMKGQGISAENAHIEWPALIRFKRTVTEPFSENAEKGFASAGIATFHGWVRFVDRTTVKVGNEDTLSGRYVVIATGAKPTKLNIPGEAYLTTSDKFMEIEYLPRRIIFVGGGYISFEFAHVAAPAGAQVQILHEGTRPLEGFDSDLVNQLVQATQGAGIDLHLNCRVKAIEKRRDHLIVRTSTEKGEQAFEADMVVHGAGRVPEIDNLDLEKAGVKHEKGTVSLNEYLQSVSNPSVYVVGDAAAKSLQLTPVAIMEGEVVASNLLEGNHHKPDYTGIPTVVFTIPPLAAVGLKGKDAQEQGLKFKVNQGDTSSWYTSRRVRMKYSGFKVLIEEKTERILGAHLLGPDVDEAINLFALAIRLGLSAVDLRRVIYAYPTSSHDISYMI